MDERMMHTVQTSLSGSYLEQSAARRSTCDLNEPLKVSDVTGTLTSYYNSLNAEMRIYLEHELRELCLQ